MNNMTLDHLVALAEAVVEDDERRGHHPTDNAAMIQTYRKVTPALARIARMVADRLAADRDVNQSGNQTGAWVTDADVATALDSRGL